MATMSAEEAKRRREEWAKDAIGIRIQRTRLWYTCPQCGYDSLTNHMRQCPKCEQAISFVWPKSY